MEFYVWPNVTKEFPGDRIKKITELNLMIFQMTFHLSISYAAF